MKTQSVLICIAFFITLTLTGQELAKNDQTSSRKNEEDEAKLYVYRPAKLVGIMINYDIYTDSVKIGRAVSSKAFETDILPYRTIEIWAKTEVKRSVTLQAEPGKAYYLRCGLRWGVLVGHPKLELVNPYHGELEYRLVSRQINRREYRRQIRNQAKHTQPNENTSN